MNEDQPATRQERREQRLRRKRDHLLQHGRNLASQYRDAILKRLKRRPKG